MSMISVLAAVWLVLRLVEKNTTAMAGLMVDAVQTVLGPPPETADNAVQIDPQSMFEQPLTDDLPPWAVDSETGALVVDPKTGRPLA